METTIKGKRVAPPEFWRFVFIMMICFLHFEEDVYDNVHILAYGGFLGVDFFFLMSVRVMKSSCLTCKHVRMLDL